MNTYILIKNNTDSQKIPFLVLFPRPLPTPEVTYCCYFWAFTCYTYLKNTWNHFVCTVLQFSHLQCVIEIGSLQPLGCALELHSMNRGLCRPLLIDVYNEYHWSCFLCTGVRISLGWISTSWITAMRLDVFLILINIAKLPSRKLWPIYTSNLQFIKCICSLFPCR